MSFYASYPPAVAGQGVPTYANFAAFPSAVTAGNGSLAIALDTDILYISNGTIWEVIANPSAAFSVGTFDSGTPSANGLHIDSSALIAQSASATNPGMINTSTQTLAGVKTFGSNPIMSGLTASQAVVTDGSKALASLAYATAATASTLAERDSNGNLTAVNMISSTASVVSAGGTTNLTPSDARVQVLTGTLNQTFKLPNANTFSQAGASYEFNNNSTGTLTVQDFSAGAICTVPTGGYARVILLAQGSSAGTWDNHFLIPANGSYGTAGMTVTGTLAATSTVTGTRLISTVATGTAPLTVASTTQVANLNAATAGSFSGSLAGDVTGTQSATVLSATTNATLTTLSGLTTASSLASVGTVTSGTWSATTIALNKGGTGQTTKAAAFDALSPMTTLSDLIIGGASGTGTRLGIGSTGNVLTVSGGNPVWAPPATSGTVTSVSMTVPTFLSVSGSPVTGSGTLGVTLSGTALPVANGGTGLTSGTSGGILGYTASGTLASSGALTANQLILGGGAGATPSTLAAGTQFQVLVMGASNPGYGQVNLAQSAAITGTLPVGNGGTGVTSVTTSPTATSFAGWDANQFLSTYGLIVGSSAAATGNTASTYRTIGNKKSSIVMADSGTAATDVAANLYFDGTNTVYSTANQTGGVYTSLASSTLAGVVCQWRAGSSVGAAAGATATLNTLGSVNANGLWTLGIAAGTQTHAINGNIAVTGTITTGGNATGIQQKILTGTTASTDPAFVSVAHGITSTKIIDLSGVVFYGAGTCIAHDYAANNIYRFSLDADATNVNVNNVSGATAIHSKTFQVIVTYTA